MFISFLELIEACKVNDVHTVKTLIEKNPGLICMTDTSSNNPYHICASYGNIDVLKYLLSVSNNKHYLNGLNREYRTPLHLAIEAGWTRCFKLLLDAGADIKKGVYSVATIFSFEPYVRNDYIRKLLEKALDTKESSIFNFSINNPPVILKRQTCADSSDFKRQTCADPQITFNFNDLLEVKKSKTLKDRINESLLPEDYKKMALEKESTLTSNFSSSASKDKEWVETLLKIPFNNYSKLSISNESKIEDIQDFFKEAVSTMDEVSYGMENIKEEILDCISQMISTKNDCMPRVLCLQGPGGVGKCLAKGTEILMFDGTLKKVEDIQVEDVIMGDDSTPRNILALGKGKDQMYKIEDVKGESYTVNSEHILTLKYSHSKIIKDDKKNSRYRVKWFDNKHIRITSKNFSYKNSRKEEAYKGAKDFLDTIVEDKVCDIPIKKYLNLSKNLKEDLKGLYTGIEFSEKGLDFDPYILGLWLGDGSKSSTVISNQDSTILKYLSSTLNKYNCYLQYASNYDYRIVSCDTSRKEGCNYMLNILRKYNLINNKHIPHIYKCNSRENRLKLLAGLIDSDGHLVNTKTGFEISQSIENEKLLNDIQYLCRSLGFSCVKRQKKTSWTYKGVKNTGLAWRLNISGDGLHEVPTLVQRKRANERLQIKNALVSGITVTPVGYNDYYGFEIDGNKRFVLGNFIVTHNTSFIRGGMSKILKRPFKQINMGGISDASYLIGHETTYTSSKPGLIINSLIECKTMNPIIFMDEIDKISTTDKGVDIQNVLIHLTDPIQNSEFQDKYFSGVNIDLSKVLFIFSCNDDTKISPILKDRLNIIRIKQPTINDKVVIGKKYLMKELCSNVGIDINMVKIEEETIKYIINKFCKDDLGVRGLKRCLETLLLKINSAIYNPMIKYPSLKGIKMSKENPFEISIKLVEEVLKKYEDKYSDLMNTMFL